MKRRLTWIFLFFLLGAISIYFITKPKIEKWIYDLPNNYAIRKTKETEVVLGKYIDGSFEVKKDGKQIGIEDYIAEFKYSDNYVSLKCLESVKEGVRVKFYIVDTKNDNIYGPYEVEEVYNEVEKRIIEEELSDWIKTISKPNQTKLN